MSYHPLKEHGNEELIQGSRPSANCFDFGQNSSSISHWPPKTKLISSVLVYRFRPSQDSTYQKIVSPLSSPTSFLIELHWLDVRVIREVCPMDFSD